MIGRRKYEALKALSLDDPTEDTMDIMALQFPNLSVGEAVKMIADYENKNIHVTTETKQSVAKYFENIYQEEKKSKPKEMTKEWLWKRFDECFKKNQGVKYARTPESIENIKPIILYFLGDQNFKTCKHVSTLSEPSFKKGLLVIGGYGNGKSSTMNAICDALRGTNIPFRKYTTNQLVKEYEECNDPIGKEVFNKKVLTGTLYFDDVLTEREASNYGKSNLMKDVLEERYDRNLRTYVTCNLKDGSDDVEVGLKQFGEKYGSRVYDRLFEMFNIIEFKGKSFRT